MRAQYADNAAATASLRPVAVGARCRRGAGDEEASEEWFRPSRREAAWRTAHADQVSVLKFIERNWRLNVISDRSRDNLPNPVGDRDNPYVPRNMPAIGDLFDMFDFDRDDRRREDGG